MSAFLLMQCRAFLKERNDDKLQKSMTLYSGESSALAAYRRDDSAQIAHWPSQKI